MSISSKLPAPLFIGLRYVFSKKNDAFVSFISKISIAGLAVGVAVLIVVLSVINGFSQELRERILGAVPHALIFRDSGELTDWEEVQKVTESIPYVKTVSPYTSLDGILTGPTGRHHFGNIVGVDPDFEKVGTSITQSITYTGLYAGSFNMIMGAKLAKMLGLEIGDSIVLTVPESSLGLSGLMPRVKRFTLSDTFEFGSDLDYQLALVHISDASRIRQFSSGSVEGLRLYFDDVLLAPFYLREVLFEVMDEDYAWRGVSWTSQYGNLFQSIQLEKKLLGLLLFLMVFVAAFNIIALLIMVVRDKQFDIALLRTMGMSRRHIVTIFLVQGAFIGLVGTISGTFIGLLVAFNITEIIQFVEFILGVEFLSLDNYFIDYFPSQVQWLDCLIIFSTGFLLSLASAIYPAYRASKIEPNKLLKEGF